MYFSILRVTSRFLVPFFFLICSILGITYSSSTIVINNNYESSGFFLNPVFYDTDFVYNKNLRYGEKRVIKDGILGYETDDGIVVVTPVNEVIEIGSGYISSYNGSTTGYGSDCALCSGTVACLTEAGNSYNLINDGVFYDDSTYGSVRVIAADNSLFPCGTVMSIDNGILDPFMAIVLDTGGAMRRAWSNGDVLIDIAFSYENSLGIGDATNMSGSAKFEIYRIGW